MKNFKEKIAGFIPHDKALHFIEGVAFFSILYVICSIFNIPHSNFIALFVSLVLVTLLELKDITYDIRDVGMAGLGILTLYIITLFNNCI